MTLINDDLMPARFRHRRQFFNIPMPQAPNIQMPNIHAPAMPNLPSLPNLPNPSGMLDNLENQVSHSFMDKVRSVLGRLLDPRFWYMVGTIALIGVFLYLFLCTPLGNMCYQCVRFSCSNLIRNVREFRKKRKGVPDEEEAAANESEKKKIEVEGDQEPIES
jgi:hypothetical protein